MGTEPAPPFDVAADRLRSFLRAQGHPTDLLWGLPEDVVHLPNRHVLVRRRSPARAAEWARLHYEAGLARGVGLAVEAVCQLGSATCATVLWTDDPDEASRRLLPERGLKLSIAVPLLPGISGTRLAWWIARRWTRDRTAAFLAPPR